MVNMAKERPTSPLSGIYLPEEILGLAFLPKHTVPRMTSTLALSFVSKFCIYPLLVQKSSFKEKNE
jgi:hypothetical protein